METDESSNTLEPNVIRNDDSVEDARHVVHWTYCTTADESSAKPIVRTITGNALRTTTKVNFSDLKSFVRSKYDI